MSSMEYERTNEANGFLDRFFKLTQHGTSVKTEFCRYYDVYCVSIYSGSNTELIICIRHAAC